jgi:NADH:ubiquinone reductase (H+-translocating)
VTGWIAPSQPAGQRPKVVIVGGGFAGVACAIGLAHHDVVDITLIDRNTYHQFQPLLYQVATYQLAKADVAYPLAEVSQHHGGFPIVEADVTAIDPVAATLSTEDGRLIRWDRLVLAAGSQAFYFRTPGAGEHSIPLYSLDDALRLRRRILALFDAAGADPSVLDEGALEFVVVGGGPTGVEISGAIAQMIGTTMRSAFPAKIVERAHVTLVDHGGTLLKAFSERSGAYAAKTLVGDGVELRLGVGVTEVGPGHVSLSDDSRIATRCVVWGGGLQAAPIAATAGLPQGRGGRIAVRPDLTVEGFDHVYAVGDIADIPTPEGGTYPQLGSVAQQTGGWAAKNIVQDLRGEERTTFRYRDKGIMAMIGRGAAVAEVGGHHALRGRIAFVAWLGVHSALMSGFHNRLDAFTDWAWDYFGSHGARPLDRTDAAVIDWADDLTVERASMAESSVPVSSR